MVVEEAYVLRRKLPDPRQALPAKVPCNEAMGLLGLKTLVLEYLDALEYEGSSDYVECDQ